MTRSRLCRKTLSGVDRLHRRLDFVAEIWKQRRAQRGNPVYDGPAEPVPVDPEHFDANGNILTIPPADIGVPDPVRRPEAVTLGRLDCHP